MSLIARAKDFVVDHSTQLFLVVLVLAINWSLHHAFFPLTFTSDATGYLETARWMSGEEVPLHPERMLKPLAPLGIVLFSFATGDLVSGMVLEVGIMYLLLAIATYLFFFSFFRQKTFALYGTIILVTSYPLIFYGLDLYTETGAIFFYILALFGAWKYLTTDDRLFFWLTTITITLGMLWKEYSAVSGLFFGLIILFHPSRSFREKLKDLTLLGGVTVGLLGAWQWYVYTMYQYSYLDWYRVGIAGDATAREYTLYHIAKSLFATVLLAWALVPVGLLKWKAFSPIERRYILILVLPSFMFLLWGYVSSRLYFIIAPLALLFILHSLRTLRVRPALFAGVAITIILLGNYAWLFANSLFRAML